MKPQRIMEQLWQEHLHAVCGGALPATDQLAVMRQAFFAGAWCQWVFAQRIQNLDAATARVVSDTIELELAREVSSPQSSVESTTTGRLAA